MFGDLDKAITELLDPLFEFLLVHLVVDGVVTGDYLHDHHCHIIVFFELLQVAIDTLDDFLVFLHFFLDGQFMSLLSLVIFESFKEVFDHFHDVLQCLQVTLELGILDRISFAIDLVLAITDVLQSEFIDVSVD